MHIYPYISDLPPCICTAFPLCAFHCRDALAPHTSGKASSSPSPRGFLPQPDMPVQPPSLISILGSQRDRDEGCSIWLPNQLASWERAPRANLQLGSPPVAPAVALSTRWSCHTGCQGGKVLERKRKKEGTEPERPLQAFCILRKHPEPTPERPPPSSAVAVLPAKTTLNAEKHYYFKTQS